MYILGIVTLLTCTLYGVQSATFYSCSWIVGPNVNCSIFTQEVSCGSNLVTYPNKCEFSRAHCNDTSLNLLHEGACTDADRPTGSPSAGADVVFDFFCTNLSHSACPTDVNKVCGSDGWTYLNYCEYEKAKCTHRELTIVSFGVCPGTA